jgi:hypothetical protein
MIVRQLHAVVEMLAGPTDVKNVDETGVLAGDGLERGHAFELAKERTLAFKRAPINNLDRAQTAGHRPRHPNFAISATTDHTQEFVIGNNRNLSGNLVRNDADFTRSRPLRQRVVAADVLIGRILDLPPETATATTIATPCRKLGRRE